MVTSAAGEIEHLLYTLHRESIYRKTSA